MPVAARWGDRQHTAGRLDPKLPLMLFNEGNHREEWQNTRRPSSGSRWPGGVVYSRAPTPSAGRAGHWSNRRAVAPPRRRAHRRPGPLERTGRVACRVSGQASAQSPCGPRCHCHIQAAVGEKAEPRVPGTPPCISGDFLLSTGLILWEFYSPVNPGRFIKGIKRDQPGRRICQPHHAEPMSTRCASRKR